jgi:hypothetical protein
MFVQSDAGRSATHQTETNDCTVVAMAHAAGITYAEAHCWAKGAGRKNRGGMRNYEIACMMRRYEASGAAKIQVVPFEPPTRPSIVKTATYSPLNGMWSRFRRPRRTGTTVAQFIRTLPKKGRFYVACTSHAFAVVGGVLMDNNYRPKMRALMSLCYEIIPTQPKVAPVSSTLTQDDINAMMARLDKIEF